jgi:PadR family transcriptional regulator, regulatory protein PadR
MATRSVERELKRGSTELLLLALLEERQRHGYELGRLIEQRTGGSIRVQAPSLYPALYRMEADGFVEGRWLEQPGKRRRRFYRITAAGRRHLASQRSVWESFYAALHRVAGLRPA